MEEQPAKGDPKEGGEPVNSRNDKEEHKTIDSHKSLTDDKVKELQNKIAFYEREHEGFQNKLLAQRQSYEQQIATLKSQLEKVPSQDNAAGVSITMSSSNKAEELEKVIQELKKANSELIAKNSHLEQENKRLALKLEVDNLVDGVVSKKQIEDSDKVAGKINEIVSDAKTHSNQISPQNKQVNQALGNLVDFAISRANSDINHEMQVNGEVDQMVGKVLDNAREQVNKENHQISEVLGQLVDFVISRANSSIHHDEEVYMVIDPLIQQTLTNVKKEVATEHEQIADVLNQVIGDAIIKAGTDVQGELNLRQMLIATFAKVKPMVAKIEKATTLEEVQLIVKDQMINAFKMVNALHSYFGQESYRGTDQDKQMRQQVEDALKEASIIASKVKFTPVDEKPVEDLKVSSDPTGAAYQEKLQKLQKKISQFEAYVEEKDQALLEQENQLSDLQDQLHVSQSNETNLKKKVDEATHQLALLKDSDKVLRELQQALRAKDASLQDAWQMASEREVEISNITAQLREAEDVAREYEGRGVNAQRMQEALDETEQIKGDFLQILNFKNELEVLIEEQTQHIELKNKKLHMFEETLRFKDSEIEKKDSLLRRTAGGADDMKKKLSQAEMKLRQITQTTLRDMKVKAKDQANEIEVLKEMVKSATKQAKAKDIDIQRLSQKIKRLEKFAEMNKGMLPMDGQSQYQGEGSSMMGIQEENENFESDGFSMPYPQQQPRRQGGMDLGLNPANYTNIEDEVQAELLQAQQQRQFNIKPSGFNSKSQRAPNPQNFGNQNSLNKNYKQKELEEAIELDRMLEIERRNQSHDVFQKKYDEKYENYYNNLAAIPNQKNNSSSMQGIFGPPSQPSNSSLQHEESAYQYKGLLPNLNNNPNRRQEIEQQLMDEINNEANMRKESKYMTPNPGPGKIKPANNYNTPMIGGNFKNDPYGMIGGGKGPQKNVGGAGPASGNKRFQVI